MNKMVVFLVVLGVLLLGGVCFAGSKSKQKTFEEYVVTGIPDDVEYVRVFTQELKCGYAVYVVRFEDKTGNPVYPKLNRKLTNPIKNYPIEKVTFDGFVLDHTGPAADDPIHRQAMGAAQSYGHIYGDRDSQPVYYYVRHTPSPR